MAAGTRCRGSGRALPGVTFGDVGAYLRGTWVKPRRDAQWWWLLGSGLLLGSALAEIAVLGEAVAHATSPRV